MDLAERSEERVVQLIRKGRQGLLKALFGRTGMILLLLLVQIGLLFFSYQFLEARLPEIIVFTTVVSVLIVIKVLNDEGNPAFKITWIILIMALPVFGILMYFYIKADLGYRLLHKRLELLLENTKCYSQPDAELLSSLRQDNRALYNLSTYTQTHGSCPVYANTETRYLPSGESMFEEMLRQLEQAEHYIFLEFFIVDEGYMWGRVLDVLERKVKAGVEVRLLYDGTCAIFRLPYNYPAKLRDIGIQCKMFAPIRPFVSTYFNNRDHRKILVIDGEVAFTGGVNLSDEYINRTQPYGHWKDTGIMLRGEAVRSFTLMFLQMWNIDENSCEYEKYLRRGASFPSQGYVIPYADSPLDNDHVGKLVYLDIINRAERYIHIMTPYLILDSETLLALMYAAARGVEVKIILPHIPDKKIPFALAHGHYPHLLRRGVQVYEYTPGFVHAKVFVSDDIKAVVGTINLDFRSFYHHFECAAYLHGTSSIADIEKDFQNTLAACHAVTAEDVKHDKLGRKLLGALMKVVSPLM